MSLPKVALATLIVMAAAATTAVAQPKPKSACGVKYLPLVVGNKWSYVPATPPVSPNESQARGVPVQPKLVVVEVKEVTTEGTKTVVKLDETIDDRTIHTSITCGAGVFEPSLDSFFYAGEPGGYFGVELGPIQRILKDVESGPSKPWTSLWREDVITTWKRTPEPGMTIDLGAGKLEIEHIYKLGAAETINVNFKQGISAVRLTVEMTGRVGITGIDKVFEMPATTNGMWFADGVGLVQVNNSQFQAFQLNEANLVK